MTIDHIIPYLLGGSGCLVLALLFLWAFYTGHIHSDREFRKVEARANAQEARGDKLQEALEEERRAVNEYARTGSTTNQLIAALTEVATARAGGSVP